jgi:hypothetical protein
MASLTLDSDAVPTARVVGIKAGHIRLWVRPKRVILNSLFAPALIMSDSDDNSSMYYVTIVHHLEGANSQRD